jgi:CBS domain-containing protein
MRTVAQILQSKHGQAVHTIGPSAPVIDALRLMAERHVGALLVMEQEQVVGIVTERDYARKVALMGRSSNQTAVRDIMTSSVLFVRPSHSNEECMALMTENRCRHFPVLDDGKLVGMISIGDLVKDMVSEQKFVIEQLEHYIRGERG